MKIMNYYRSHEVEEGITCIKSVLTGEFMYLVEGKDRAILIDTGMGLGNVKEYVEGLTDLPYDVVLSHGHIDHIGGAFLYRSVYINPGDISLFKEHGNKELREESLKNILKEHSMPEDDYVPVRDIELLPLENGYLFNLGGLTIEVIEAPGHTPGSVCFLLRERRILFTGDACNSFTFLFLDESLPIQEYQKTVGMLLDMEGRYARILLSHGIPVVPASIIQDVYDCCTDIMKGNVDDVPYSFMGRKAYIAKRQDPRGGRADGKLGNIVYRKDNIYS
jgi:glyoxylase-like metal-dependent hydrolase (beta-lactamase superfamily II)